MHVTTHLGVRKRLNDSNQACNFTVDMCPSWKMIVLFVVVSLTGRILANQVADYIASLILHLGNQQLGSFDCWFYDTTDQWTDSILNDILVSSQLELIPRRVLNSTEQVEVQRSPALVLVNYNSNHHMRIGAFLASKFDRSVKAIVFYNNTPELELEFPFATSLLRVLQLHNAIFVSSDALVIHQKMAFQSKFTVHRGVVPFEKLFVDPLSNLSGHTFHISHSKRMDDSYLLEDNRSSSGYFIK